MTVKKVLIHGATMGTNFGDFLFADLFYNYVVQIVGEENVAFYESRFAFSEFFRTHLDYKNKYKKESINEAEILIYIPGGYFGEWISNFRENLYRYLRYFVIGREFIRKKKKIIIIGVGAGPLTSKILQRSAKHIFEYANLVVVRDEMSKKYMLTYGVRKDIKVTADAAQIIQKDYFAEYSNSRQVTSLFLDGYKTIFLHVNPTNNDLIIQKIIPAVKQFLNRHEEYKVIIGCDQYNKEQKIVLNDLERRFTLYNCAVYYYEYPKELCALLSRVDFVITTKLHVGIVASTLGKAVVSIAGHYNKIKRYYTQIGEDNRCIELETSNTEDIYNLIETYYMKPILIPKQILEDAQKNFEYLKEYLEENF